MKQLLFLIILLVTCFCTQAQITVTSTTLPALGDTLRYAWAYNQATFSMITPPGFDLTWDFTALTSNKIEPEIYRSPSQGQFAAKFPDANLLVIDSVGERYYRVTTSGLELLGYSENLLFGYPFTVLYKIYHPYKERFTPLNFFDSYAQSTSYLEGFRFAELPAALQAIYLSIGLTTTDSIRLRGSIMKLVGVSAYGTVSIPGPDPKPAYAVLRQNQTQYRERRVDAHVIPLGWLDITDLTIQYVPGSRNSLGIDTMGAHIFLNDVTKEEIVRIELDAEGRPGNIRFKNNFSAGCTWTGSAGNAWENAANWSCGRVPGATDDIIINSGTIVINAAVTIRSFKTQSRGTCHGRIGFTNGVALIAAAFVSIS